MPGPAFAPMVVEGDMASDGGVGLGCLSWWASGNGNEGAAQGVEGS